MAWNKSLNKGDKLYEPSNDKKTSPASEIFCTIEKTGNSSLDDHCMRVNYVGWNTHVDQARNSQQAVHCYINIITFY
jgi:hypothetical protein